MTQTAKQVKQVQIIARYVIKRTGAVVSLVRSSKGDATYCTTIINDKATGCTCDSRRPCKHMKACEIVEANRVAAQPACVVAAYDVVTEAVKVAARAQALPLDAYEVLAATKHVSHVTYCSECGKLSRSGLCGRCAWGC